MGAISDSYTALVAVRFLLHQSEGDNSVIALGTFFVVALISMVLTRIITGALIATGLPVSVAKFQARSAFTTVGFTTAEAEAVVANPQRRQILSWAMLIGNLGTPTLVVTVILSFAAPGPGDTEARLVVFALGAAVLLLLVSNRFVERWLVRWGRRFMLRRLASQVREDFEELLAIDGDNAVGKITLRRDPEGPHATVLGFEHAARDLRVLAIRRTGNERDELLGTVSVDTLLEPGDEVLAYGPRASFERVVHAADA